MHKYLYLSNVLPLFVSFRDHEKFTKSRKKFLDNTAQMNCEEIECLHFKQINNV